MNQASPISLDSQWLTPKRLMWVMDVGHCSINSWQNDFGLEYFKVGSNVRYAPEAVTRFILSHTVRARAASPLAISPAGSQPAIFTLGDEAWRRIERLIADQVAAQKQKAA